MRLRRLHAEVPWICNVDTALTVRQPIPYRMDRTPQDVYASNLLRGQSFGYPLRNPRPKDKSDLGGLRVGDVGYVDKNGTFNLAFNISSPPNELQDVIPGFPLAQPDFEQAFKPGEVFVAGVQRILDVPRCRHHCGYTTILTQ